MQDMTGPASGQPIVLLVDDEVHVTRSLQRALRGAQYQLMSAESGAAALQLMEQNPVDLVISDARMPGMGGVEFLTQVKQRWPECMRILLTGYAEVGTTIKAINEGRIHRYISKPWDDDELRYVVRQSLAFRHSEQERLRLQKLTEAQNAALQEMNANLELRVQQRTAELARTAELLDKAHAELERSYVTATEVFSSLINQRLPPSRQTNREVIALLRAFCAAHQLARKDTHDLAMAGALYNIGKLTWGDALIALPPDRMQKEDRARYREYPRIGQSLLMALEPAQDAAAIIGHHQERWDGGGFPHGLAGESIPYGARLLKLAVDFVELQMGMVLSRKLQRDEVLKTMPQYAGRLYDPVLCEQFLEVAASIPDDEAAAEDGVTAVGTLGLIPGMILARNLYAQGGMLLLGEGKVLSAGLIEKLQTFENNEGANYTLYVRHPDPEDDGD